MDLISPSSPPWCSTLRTSAMGCCVAWGFTPLLPGRLCRVFVNGYWTTLTEFSEKNWIKWYFLKYTHLLYYSFSASLLQYSIEAGTKGDIAQQFMAKNMNQQKSRYEPLKLPLRTNFLAVTKFLYPKSNGKTMASEPRFPSTRRFFTHERLYVQSTLMCKRMMCLITFLW